MRFRIGTLSALTGVSALLVLLAVTRGRLAADAPEAEKPEYKTLAEKAGYAVGLHVGRNSRRMHAEVEQLGIDAAPDQIPEELRK